jgi:hypothetical protein
MSKFQALKTLLQDAIPAVAKEGEEAVASTIAKEAEEKLAEDAAREAFKAEFNLDVAHGTSLENIANKRLISNKKYNPVTGDYETVPYSELVGPITKFEPNDSINGVGIFTAPYEKNMEHWDGPNYKFNEYSRGEGSHTYPLKLRGKKTFNYDHSFYPTYDSSGVLSHNESFEKLSELTKIPVEELRKKPIYEIEKLVKQYPETFENFLFEGQIKTYDPKNIRSPFAKFDPAKKDSSDFMAGLGAATLGAGALSSEAKAEPTKSPSDFTNIKKQLIKDYSPSFGSKEGDFSSYDESEALPTEGMQGRGLATIIRNMVADKKTPGEFEEGGGGITEPAISPIDFITPGMVTSPLQYKKLLKVIGK